MIETEKAILATAIEYPETRFFFFENCDQDFFISPHAQEIFKTMRDLYLEDRDFTWMTIIDLCEVPSSYMSSLPLTLQAVHNTHLFMRQNISLIKNVRAKKNLLREIHKEAEAANPDFEQIQQIIAGTKIIELETEDHDFQSAYEEYLSWREKKTINIRLGLPTFDRWIGGFRYGEIISILARTSVGKTFLALKFVQEIQEDLQAATGFFSFEMPKPAIIERMLQTYFSLWREDLALQIKELKTEEFKRKYEKLKLYTHPYTISEISKIAERDRLKIVFIDFLQLVKDEDGGASAYERTSKKMRDLKHFAMSKDVLIFLLVQLSRKAGSGWEVVTIDSARESGQIEELSDFIVGAWNPSLNPNLSEVKKQMLEGSLKLALLKNKRGPTASINANFSKKSGKIYEMEES